MENWVLGRLAQIPKQSLRLGKERKREEGEANVCNRWKDSSLSFPFSVIPLL